MCVVMVPVSLAIAKTLSCLWSKVPVVEREGTVAGSTATDWHSHRTTKGKNPVWFRPLMVMVRRSTSVRCLLHPVATINNANQVRLSDCFSM